jgi:pilus assembly protein CpaB
MAAVCGGLASSIVSGYARDVRAQVGPLTPVLVVRTPVPRSRLFTPANVSRYVAARRVPVRFVPPRSFRFASDLVGLRSLTAIPVGSYLSEGQLADASQRRSPGRLVSPGRRRVVEVPVAGTASFQNELRPGSRVDVLVTSERGAGAARTYLALQRIELAGFRPGLSGEASADESRPSLASLRVTLRQAVLLTAAENFAREIRIVPRAPGEDRLLPPTAVSANDLHP